MTFLRCPYFTSRCCADVERHPNAKRQPNCQRLRHPFRWCEPKHHPHPHARLWLCGPVVQQRGWLHSAHHHFARRTLVSACCLVLQLSKRIHWPQDLPAGFSQWDRPGWRAGDRHVHGRHQPHGEQKTQHACEALRRLYVFVCGGCYVSRLLQLCLLRSIPPFSTGEGGQQLPHQLQPVVQFLLDANRRVWLLGLLEQRPVVGRVQAQLHQLRLPAQ